MEEAVPKPTYSLYVLVFSTGCRKVNKWCLDLNLYDAVWFMLLVFTCSK